MRILTLVSLLVLIGSAVHATTPILPSPPTEISGRIQGKALFITLVPPTQYHFNLKAPISLQRKTRAKTLKPSEAKQNKIEFKIPSPQTEDFVVNIFLCDDAKNWCEKQSKIIHWDSEKSFLSIKNS